jgi:hypothetical protein
MSALPRSCALGAGQPWCHRRAAGLPQARGLQEQEQRVHGDTDRAYLIGKRRNGVGGWQILSQRRPETFYRRVWVTLWRAGTRSSVSVKSAGKWLRSSEPQHRQVSGAGITTLWRGRSAGKSRRVLRLRVKAATVVVFAAAIRPRSSASLAFASSRSNVSSS